MKSYLAHIAFTLTLSLLTASVIAATHDHAAMMAMQSDSALPSESLHRVNVPLVDQQGKTFRLADEHKPATLITMFYGDCQTACPIAIENIKRTLAALDPTQRTQVRALMISLNPGIDTAKSLAKLAGLHKLSPQTYRLAVAADDAQTRQIAATLGIKYRRVAKGEVNHSTRFLVMNERGVVIASSDKLSVEPDPQLLTVLKQVKP